MTYEVREELPDNVRPYVDNIDGRDIRFLPCDAVDVISFDLDSWAEGAGVHLRMSYGEVGLVSRMGRSHALAFIASFTKAVMTLPPEPTQ